MQAVKKPTWQQATALVSLSTCGAMTGISFAHGTRADITSPASMPVHLMEFRNAGNSAPAGDAALRSAIVDAAQYYLRLAQGKTPAEIEALIWQSDSTDGADHGASCAAFASLTLETGARVTGQESWVTGGSTYPWPLHQWADVRVDPNPASPGIISILQDAQAHDRWHPLGDGYTPQPGDWVLFPGHVEVVTGYSGGILDTIGGDSSPNLSVNAHQYRDPLGEQGVAGFVNNGQLLSQVMRAPGAQESPAQPGSPGQPRAEAGQAAIPGLFVPAATLAGAGGQAAKPAPAAPPVTAGAQAALPAIGAIPGLQPITGTVTSGWSARPSPRYTRSVPTPSPGLQAAPESAVQQAFISQVAAGAAAAQQKYGIPAAVTIAQAIDESGWGQSQLAIGANNLFGIKGTGPAGSVMQPTQEYLNGQWVSITAPFRVYHSLAESIDDHSLLLATGSSYKQAMADKQSPDAFANDLTGVYATDPQYGASLISIMRMYNLYRYDDAAAAAGQPAPHLAAAPPARAAGAAPGSADIPGLAAPFAATPASASEPGRGGPADPAAASGSTSRSGVQTGPAGSSRIPGLAGGKAPAPAAMPAAAGVAAPHAAPGGAGPVVRAGPRTAHVSTRRYVPEIPAAVTTAFVTMAKTTLIRNQPLYHDVASSSRLPWQVLAACDWMQCKAEPRHSPVHGEKLGSRNPDGSRYRTRSEALAQCADDLIELASAVYRIDLTSRIYLSVHELAGVFAAFRWGGLLMQHRISAMEFPYAVAGLTAQHLKMRWPDIPAPQAPDRPGTRFRQSFGAVPVVLSLDYPALT